MGRKRNRLSVQEFSLGDPEPVMGNLLDYLGVFMTPWAGYYEPPVSLHGLSKMRHANAHHGSCLTFKRNIISRFLKPNAVISMRDFRAAAYDYHVFGNCYFQEIFNRFGGLQRLKHQPALNIRRKADTPEGISHYCWLPPERIGPIDFQPGEILHAFEYDTMQQIYGIPDWLCALQALLLNEDATLFRRKYYKNGCHIGYILYTADPNLDPKTEKSLQKKISEGKGAGNFRSLYINIPNGKEKAVQVIPVGDISQRDEFQRIKDISANDVIVGHRVQPALAGLQPQNTQGFGDVEKITRVYVETEVKPMAQPFQDLNQSIGFDVFEFDFDLDTATDVAA